MSFDPDTTRIVRSWLNEGATQLPDRVLDAVLDQVPSTRQRRATWWPARTTRDAHPAMAVVYAAAAAAVAILLIGLGLLNAGRTGGPSTDDAKPSSPAAVTVLPAEYDRPLEPGRYSLGHGFPADITFDVPEGWTACGASSTEQAICGTEVTIAFLVVENVVVHPCNAVLRDPPAGRSLDSFLSAVADLTGFSATEPTEVRRGAVTGMQITVTAPMDPQCPFLRTWSVEGRTNGVHAGEVNVIEVFDLGERLVAVMGTSTVGVSAAEDVDEVRAMMESMELGP